MSDNEGATWKVHATLRKWHSDEDREAGLEPYEVLEIPGNVLTYGGVSAIWEKLTNGTISAAPAGSGNDYRTGTGGNYAYIGVGDGTTAAAASQTALQGSNIAYVAGTRTHTDSVSSSGATISYSATFGAGTGTFTWNEWGLFNSNAPGRMLNRKVFTGGVKAAGDSWTFTVSITIS